MSIRQNEDPIVAGGWHYSTTCGNGDPWEWEEYQAELNRDKWKEYGIDPNWLPPLFEPVKEDK